VQSRWYRAPEVIMGVEWDGRIDVWSLACVLGEVVVGQPLFRRSSSEGMLAAYMAVLGEIPKWMCEANEPLSQMFLTANRRPYQVNPHGMSRGVYMLQPLPQCGLKKVIETYGSRTIFGASFDQFIDFLTQMLTIDPKRRLTASQGLEHPWVVSQSPWPWRDTASPSRALGSSFSSSPSFSFPAQRGAISSTPSPLSPSSSHTQPGSSLVAWPALNRLSPLDTTTAQASQPKSVLSVAESGAQLDRFGGGPSLAGDKSRPTSLGESSFKSTSSEAVTNAPSLLASSASKSP